VFDAGGPQSNFIMSVTIVVAFEHFQYISLSEMFAKLKVSHSMCSPH